MNEKGKTSRDNVYAGGDAVTGAATVISAMGAGKQAAAAIDEALGATPLGSDELEGVSGGVQWDPKQKKLEHRDRWRNRRNRADDSLASKGPRFLGADMADDADVSDIELT